MCTKFTPKSVIYRGQLHIWPLIGRVIKGGFISDDTRSLNTSPQEDTGMEKA